MISWQICVNDCRLTACPLPASLSSCMCWSQFQAFTGEYQHSSWGVLSSRRINRDQDRVNHGKSNFHSDNRSSVSNPVISFPKLEAPRIEWYQIYVLIPSLNHGCWGVQFGSYAGGMGFDRGGLIAGGQLFGYDTILGFGVCHSDTMTCGSWVDGQVDLFDF